MPHDTTRARPVEILLVEDNPGDVDLTRAALERSKIRNHLQVAGNVEEAIAILRRRDGHEQSPRPDLVLLDLKLPGRGGHELLAEIKADPALQAIPVVVLTSSDADTDVARSYALHANCYVTKPLDFAQFQKVVQSIRNFWFSIVTLPSGDRS